MKKTNIILAAVLIFSLTSCSLNYEKTEKSKFANVPNFSFKDATYSKYENNSVKIQIQSDVMEQYMENNSIYASNPEFYIWNDENQVTAQGKCKFLGINNTTNNYTLYNNIYIQDFQNNLFIQGDSLRYNSKTDQMVSGKNDLIYLEKDDILLQGKGFSGSGVTHSYSFQSDIKGEIKNSSESDTKSLETQGN